MRSKHDLGDYRRNINLMREYGLSLVEYTKLLDAQHGCCAICKNAESAENHKGTLFSLAVDHCHATGKIRGLLCRRCNQILGRVKDNVEILRTMAAYVEVANTGLRTAASAKIITDDLIAELKNA